MFCFCDIVKNMRGHKKIVFILILALAFCFCKTVLAHQPQIVGSAASVTIKDPEISKAYYGKLVGSPAVYTINAPAPFHLYVQLLSPQTNVAKTDFSWIINKDGQLLAQRESADSLWPVTYEPFGNDYYFQGPEFETDSDPGVYTIEISNPDNQGVYALAVGKIEAFSLSGLVATLAVLPVLKTEYFNEPVWTAYNNFTGLFALIAVVAIGIVLYVLIRMVFIWRLNKKLDHEYKKLRKGGEGYG